MRLYDQENTNPARLCTKISSPMHMQMSHSSPTSVLYNESYHFKNAVESLTKHKRQLNQQLDSPRHVNRKFMNDNFAYYNSSNQNSQHGRAGLTPIAKHPYTPVAMTYPTGEEYHEPHDDLESIAINTLMELKRDSKIALKNESKENAEPIAKKRLQLKDEYEEARQILKKARGPVTKKRKFVQVNKNRHSAPMTETKYTGKKAYARKAADLIRHQQEELRQTKKKRRIDPMGIRKSGEIIFGHIHRVSCHRCGNLRKNKFLCTECPHVFCKKCAEKMLIEHGMDVFEDGCPVCKKLCCCAAKYHKFCGMIIDGDGIQRCNRMFHCYKKCPTTRATKGRCPKDCDNHSDCPDCEC